MMSGYEVFKIFVPIKQHFNSKKYNFYEKRGYIGNLQKRYKSENQRRTFELLGKAKHNKATVFRFFVSQLQEDPRAGIESMLGVEADNNYRRWLARISSMDYVFTESVKVMHLADKSWKEYLIDGDIPLIIPMMDSGQVSKETVLILDGIFGMFDKWDKNIVTEDRILQLNNYRDFLDINITRYRQIFKGITWVDK